MELAPEALSQFQVEKEKFDNVVAAVDSGNPDAVAAAVQDIYNYGNGPFGTLEHRGLSVLSKEFHDIAPQDRGNLQRLSQAFESAEGILNIPVVVIQQDGPEDLPGHNM